MIVVIYGKRDDIQYLLSNLYRHNFIYLKGCEPALKEAPTAAAREALPIIATKLKSAAQCGTVSVPPITGPPKMSKSWLIRGGTVPWKNETLEEKRGPMNCVNYLIGRFHGPV